MERILQYLDDLDDLYGMLGLVFERVRRAVVKLLSLFVLAVVTATAAALAVMHPPVGLAAVTLLFVTLLYRGVTTSPAAIPGATR